MITGALWDRGDRDHARRQAAAELETYCLIERDDSERLVADGDREKAWIASDTWVNARGAR